MLVATVYNGNKKFELGTSSQQNKSSQPTCAAKKKFKIKAYPATDVHVFGTVVSQYQNFDLGTLPT